MVGGPGVSQQNNTQGGRDGINGEQQPPDISEMEDEDWYDGLMVPLDNPYEED